MADEDNPFLKYTKPAAPPVARQEPVVQPADPGGSVLPEVTATQNEPLPPEEGNPFLRYAAGERRAPTSATTASGKPPDWALPEGAQGPPIPDIGIPASTAIGAVNSASMNFADELLGLTAASPTPALGVMAPLTGAARLAYEYFTGHDTGGSKAAEEMRDKWRNWSKTAESQHPGWNLAGGVAGAVIAPIKGAGLVRGAPMMQRIGQGATTGAVMGGLSGVGEGEDLEGRVKGGASGVVIGTLAGGAVPPVAGAVGAGLSYVWNKARGAYEVIARTEDAAQRWIAQTVQSAQRRGGPQTILEPDVADLVARGQPVMNVDLAGPKGRKMLRWAKGTPDAEEAVAEAETRLQRRFDTQSRRATDHVYRVTGVGTQANLERIMEANRRANLPAYNRANAAALAADRALPQDTHLLWTPELQRLSQDPDIKAAMLGVGRKEAKRSIIMDNRQTAAGDVFVERPDSQRLALRVNQNGSPIIRPQLQAWDNVQRTLRGQLDEARRGGNRERVRELTLTRDRLLQELDGIVPSYEAARGTAYRGFKAEDAYEAGWNYVEMSLHPREREALARQIANMSQNERDLFHAGFAQKLISDTTDTSLNQNIVTRMLNDEGVQGRAREALGNSQYQEIRSFIDVERLFERARRAFSGSETAENLRYAAWASSLGGLTSILSGDITTGTGTGMAVAGARYGLRRAQTRVAERVAELLTSNDASDFQRGITLLSRNHAMRENLNWFANQFATKPAASQAPGRSVGPATGGAARGEDEQAVPGPPQ